MNTKLREKLGIPSDGRREFQINYGHTNDNIVVAFGDKVDNLTMTVAQCDAMLAALQGVRGAFLKHRGKKRG